MKKTFFERESSAVNSIYDVLIVFLFSFKTCTYPVKGRNLSKKSWKDFTKISVKTEKKINLQDRILTENLMKTRLKT